MSARIRNTGMSLRMVFSPITKSWTLNQSGRKLPEPSPRDSGEKVAEGRMRGGPHPALRATLSRAAGEGSERSTRPSARQSLLVRAKHVVTETGEHHLVNGIVA